MGNAYTQSAGGHRMNIKQLREEIRIAKEQASISESKAAVAQKEGDFYNNKGYLASAEVYRVRAKALHLFATELLKKIRKHDNQHYKKINNNESV